MSNIVLRWHAVFDEYILLASGYQFFLLSVVKLSHYFVGCRFSFAFLFLSVSSALHLMC